MTRACIALARGDWNQALHYNPLSMGLVLFAGAYALAPGSLRQKWARLTPGIRRTTKWAVLASVLGWNNHARYGNTVGLRRETFAAVPPEIRAEARRILHTAGQGQ